jgi:hypothetical protein
VAYHSVKEAVASLTNIVNKKTSLNRQEKPEKVEKAPVVVQENSNVVRQLETMMEIKQEPVEVALEPQVNYQTQRIQENLLEVQGTSAEGQQMPIAE